MLARVATVDGVLEVDLETEEVEIGAGTVVPQHFETGLPRVVCAVAAGSTVVAVVDARPPMLVSYDAGQTWNEAGRGLPPGFAVAVLEDNPDIVLYAARNRLYLSRDGGRFWEPLAVELPGHRGGRARALDSRRLSGFQRLAGHANDARDRPHFRLAPRRTRPSTVRRGRRRRWRSPS